MWSSIGIFGKQTIVFVVGIILARILDPKDFGLIGMILVFSNLGQVFIDFGFSRALIQHKSVTQEDLSTVFYTNLLIGVSFASLFYLSSVLIARFYNQEELIQLVKFMSLIFVFSSISIIQRTILFKRMDLKSESTVIILASLVSGSLAIYLAYSGMGVWSLAVKIIAQSFMEAVLFWLFGNWIPGFVFKISSLKKYFRYAMNMFGSGVLNMLAQNLDVLVIGKIFSANVLGFYDRAKQFNATIQQNIGMVYIKVMFPALSELQDDEAAFKNTYRRSIQLIAFLVIPFFFLLVVLAKPLILILLTEKWLPSVQILQILACAGFIYPIAGININAIAAKGRADIFLKLDMVKTTLFLVALLFGSIWGILGVVISISITRYIVLFIHFIVLSKIIKLPVLKQIQDIFLPFIFGGVMLLALFLLTTIVTIPDIYAIFILPILGLGLYIVLFLIVSPGIVKEFIRVIKNALL